MLKGIRLALEWPHLKRFIEPKKCIENTFFLKQSTIEAVYPIVQDMAQNNKVDEFLTKVGLPFEHCAIVIEPDTVESEGSTMEKNWCFFLEQRTPNQLTGIYLRQTILSALPGNPFPRYAFEIDIDACLDGAIDRRFYGFEAYGDNGLPLRTGDIPEGEEKTLLLEEIPLELLQAVLMFLYVHNRSVLGYEKVTETIKTRTRDQNRKLQVNKYKVSNIIHLAEKEYIYPTSTSGNSIEWKKHATIKGTWRRLFKLLDGKSCRELGIDKSRLGKNPQGERCVQGYTWVIPHERNKELESTPTIRVT